MLSPNRKSMKTHDCPTEPAITPSSNKKIRPIRKQHINFNANQYRVKRREAKNWSFSGGRGDNKEALKILSVALKSTKKIQKLEIDSGVSDDILDSGFSPIAKRLKGLQSLTTLSLDLSSNYYFTDVGLSDLGCGLKIMKPSLRSFHLNVGRCEMISDDGIKKLRLRRLPGLQDIQLNFKPWEGVGDKGMEIISEALGKMTCLKSLALNFKDCQELTDTGVEALGETLYTLTSLQRIKLNFFFCHNIYDGSFVQGIKSLTSLRAVEINLGASFAITGGTPMKQLGQALKTLTSIEKLRLSFEVCPELEDADIKNLAQGLKNLHSLKNLELHLSQGSQVPEKSMKYLSESFNYLKSLKTMKIEWSVNHDDQKDQGWSEKGKIGLGLKSFGQNLKKLTSLINLDLDFDCCNGLTDKGISNFSQGLRGLASLQSLRIFFQEAKKVGEEGLQSFGQALNALKSLKKIIHGFHGKESMMKLDMNFV